MSDRPYNIFLAGPVTQGSASLKFRRERRPNIGAALAHNFADGKWYTLTTIAEKLKVETSHAERTLLGMQWTGAYGCRAEKRRGKEVQWRIFKLEKSIPVTELLSEIRPLVQALRIEGRKNMVTMSPATVAVLAGRLEKLLQKWSDRSLPSESRQRGRQKDSLRGASHVTGRSTADASSGPTQLPAGEIHDRAADARTGDTVRNNDPESDGTPAGRKEGEVPPRQD